MEQVQNFLSREDLFDLMEDFEMVISEFVIDSFHLNIAKQLVIWEIRTYLLFTENQMGLDDTDSVRDLNQFRLHIL